MSDRPTESPDSQQRLNDYDEIYNNVGQIDRVVHIKPTKSIKSRFIELQKWEGIVLQVLKDSFIGRLINLTQDEPDSEAELHSWIDGKPASLRAMFKTCVDP